MLTGVLLWLVGLLTSFVYPWNDIRVVSVTSEEVKVGMRFTVEVNTSAVIARTSERFLSFGFSPYYLRNNSDFDIRCPRVKTLLTGLAPSILRLGGTEGELLTFQASGDYAEDVSRKQASCYFERIPLETQLLVNYTLTGAEWDTVNRLAEESGARVAFGLSAIRRKDGIWDPGNALELLDYTLDKPYAGNLDWELGNEPNSYKHKFSLNLSANDHGKDFVALHQILRDVSPYKEVFENSLIIGPDITQPKKKKTLHYAASFLSEAGQTLDGISWHHYYVSSKDPSTSIKSFIDPAILDSLQGEIEAINHVVGGAGLGHTPMWIGECSSASGGGVVNVSDRYVAGFMWLDRLGLVARSGINVVVRWSFVHSSYSLLDENLYPLPDYWLSWVYKSLVDTHVLNVTCLDKQRKVRIYAHCTKQSSQYHQGAITLYGMNLYTDDVTLDLPPTLERMEKHMYLLTPHGREGLTSSHVNLNSEKLEMVDDVTLPQLKPVVLAPGSKLKLPGLTFGFLVIPSANLKSCMN